MDGCSDIKRLIDDAGASGSSPARDELTALDQAIGDGDHGINMKRGFEAVLAELDAQSPPSRCPAALHKASA